MRVFLTSPWIPEVWIRAHGLEPHGIGSEAEFRRGALPLSAGVCAFAEAVVRFAEARTDSTVIFTTSCDQLRRGFDTALFHGRSRVFLFNLPSTQNSTAKQIYRSELERLGQFLVKLGGRAPTPDLLRREMLQADLRNREIASHQTTRTAAPPGNRVPLALVGGPRSATDGALFDAIETAGGRVVLDATENGERSQLPTFDLTTNGDPFDVLANECFKNIVDVFQRPNTRLYAWLKSRLLSRRARGILLWHFSVCDLWRAEAQTLRDAFGLPVLPLEAGETTAISMRDVNRLQAFIETLK